MIDLRSELSDERMYAMDYVQDEFEWDDIKEHELELTDQSEAVRLGWA